MNPIIIDTVEVLLPDEPAIRPHQPEMTTLRDAVRGKSRRTQLNWWVIALPFPSRCAADRGTRV